MYKTYFIFTKNSFKEVIFRPLCAYVKGPNMNCQCVDKCRDKPPYKFLLSCSKVKYLPMRSRSSEVGRIYYQK